MGYSNQFYSALGLNPSDRNHLSTFAKACGIETEKLKYYNDHNILPSGRDLEKILSHAKISEVFLRLKMGRLDKNTLDAIQKAAESIAEIIPARPSDNPLNKKLTPDFKTRLGKLYQTDCMNLLKMIDSDSVDLVFADPPFNLAKLYPSQISDSLRTEQYLQWCEQWLSECIRVLKPGGSIFVWNLPKWNSALSGFLHSSLTFRNWIGVDIKYSLPIQNRLYPSHYSLIYYTKGEKPKTFHPDRLPMQTCPKCYGDLKDYGGYKDKMNPLGINMSDIWTDIPPVRHAKYKRREGANELSLKLLDRIIEMSSDEGDLILDPFGGSGTTYMAAELKKRKWIGAELGPIDVITERFELINSEREILNNYRKNINSLFPDEIQKNRLKRGLWTCETVSKTPVEYEQKQLI